MPNLAVAPDAAPLSALNIERARDMLALAVTTDEVVAIRDKALAAHAYAASIKAGREVQNLTTEIVIRAERRFGELVDELPATPPGERGQGRRRPNGGSTEESANTTSIDSPRAKAIADAGLTSTDVSRCRKLAAIDSVTFDSHIRSTQARGQKLTRSGAIAAVSHGEDYDSDSWTTPPEVIDAVRRVLGEIDLDPASNDKSQRTVKAKKYYTLADDGIARTWKGRVFCNPPYSQPACTRFANKFITEVESGRVTKGIILLNSSTDTRSHHDLARRYPSCYTIGRIGFLQPDGTKVDGNRVGQVLFAAGCGRAFAEVFESGDDPIGLVLQRPGT